MDPVEHRDNETYLKSQHYPPNSTKNTKRYLRQNVSSYSIKSGLLVKCLGEHYPIVVTNDKVSDILKEVHDNVGHQCFRYSYNIAQERFYWPKCAVKFSLTSLSVDLSRKISPPWNLR